MRSTRTWAIAALLAWTLASCGDEASPTGPSTGADVTADTAADAMADVTADLPPPPLDAAEADQAGADAADVTATDALVADAPGADTDATSAGSGCVACHTDQALLQQLAPADPAGSTESAAG